MAALGRFLHRWLPRRAEQWRIVAEVEAGDAIPDVISERGVVLVGSRSKPTWAAFDCPCRRGHRIMINLDPARRPTWRIESRRPLSIRPSIDDITAERRCHFFVRGGKVVWAGKNGGRAR